jgi:UDP-N-acetyl-2-amino-2-deoxyglucuronate dehydrogenase
MNQSLHNFNLLHWNFPNIIKSIKAFIKNCNYTYIQARHLDLAKVEFEHCTIALIVSFTIIYIDNLEEVLFIFGERGTIYLTEKPLNQIVILSYQNKLNFKNVIKNLFLTINLYLTEKTRNKLSKSINPILERI